MVSFGAALVGQRSAFVVNLESFYGLVAFVKTEVSFTRNTHFEGWAGARTQTFHIFSQVCLCSGLGEEALTIFYRILALTHTLHNTYTTPYTTFSLEMWLGNLTYTFSLEI